MDKAHGFNIRKQQLIFLLSLAVLCTWLNARPAQAENLGEAGYGLTNQIVELYNSKDGLLTNEANTICQTRDGYIWVGSYSGLMRYDGRSFFVCGEEEDGIRLDGIRALYEDEHGRLWIGTNEDGVFWYDGTGFYPTPKEADSLSDSIR